MKQTNKIDVRFWPFKLAAEGDEAIAAVKWPKAIVLLAVAVAIGGLIVA